jgi:putative FmdB family regulatory protein
MPVYTYRCESCGIQFEKTQKFSDQPLTRCPECNQKALRKVYTPVGIVFKGSGWYSTDNRSPSGLNRSATEKSNSTEKNGESSTVEKKADPAPVATPTPAPENTTAASK